MRRKVAIAAVLAATLFGAAACGGDDKGGETTKNPLDGTGTTLKVWLMVDAQSGWQNVVDDATARYKAATGGDVKVEYQQWSTVLTNLDTALAGSDVPDVVELGNTQMSKYVFDGAFAELDKTKFENSANWLTGLSGACDFEGKQYCAPYYAGARVLIYRTDLFEKSGLKPPTTYDELLAAAAKLKADNAGDKNFAAFYMPGAYWYAAMSWVYNEGGAIAKNEGGKWTGTLSSPEAQAGLTKWADLVKNYSKGDVTKDEADQDAVFAQGHAAMLYGNGWELGAVQQQRKDPNDPNSPMVDTKVKGKVAAVALPGATAGKGIPSFLGGSDLAITEKSKQKELAQEWLKYFTDSTANKGLIAKGALPNATNLMDEVVATKPDNAAAANAAKSSWFVPVAPHWADVEQQGVLVQMLRDIVTGKATIADATKAADDKITAALNQG
ncbi:extracellular solute-binding protein [Luedemannella helvata]|uniref:Sugar ABC transporter substrate-binding protein n=1 Tax=Luedemannella helvata TaxID=349315 RepID=A0ABP4WVJ3_9ACTN